MSKLGEKKLKCRKCGYSWVYRGRRKVMVTCPDCRKTVDVGARK